MLSKSKKNDFFNIKTNGWIFLCRPLLTSVTHVQPNCQNRTSPLALYHRCTETVGAAATTIEDLQSTDIVVWIWVEELYDKMDPSIWLMAAATPETVVKQLEKSCLEDSL